MKKARFAGGILLVALALVLTIMALAFPDNGMFAALWRAGIFTFRGDPSLTAIYLTSGLSFLLGACLLVSHAKGKEDV